MIEDSNMKNNAIEERLCLKMGASYVYRMLQSKSTQETRLQMRRQIGGCRIRTEGVGCSQGTQLSVRQG